MALRFLVFFMLFAFWLPVSGGFPTLERVDYALTCMKEKGGQTVESLYACSCEIDFVSANMPLEDYIEARTFEIYRAMPGEKGGLFRGKGGRTTAVAKLEDIRQKAANRCNVRRAGSK